MLLNEFIEKYCDDIMKKAQFKKLHPNDIFKFDSVTDEGERIIYDGEGREIPIEEILQLPFSEFVSRFPFQSSADAFKNYVSAYTNTVGEDVLLQLANDAKRVREQLATYRDKSVNDLMEL